MDTKRANAEQGANSATPNSMQGMIDEAKKINENARRSAAGARYMSDIITYITAESKRRMARDDKVGDADWRAQDKTPEDHADQVGQR